MYFDGRREYEGKMQAKIMENVLHDKWRSQPLEFGVYNSTWKN